MYEWMGQKNQSLWLPDTEREKPASLYQSLRFEMQMNIWKIYVSFLFKSLFGKQSLGMHFAV